MSELLARITRARTYRIRYPRIDLALTQRRFLDLGLRTTTGCRPPA